MLTTLYDSLTEKTAPRYKRIIENVLEKTLFELPNDVKKSLQFVAFKITTHAILREAGYAIEEHAGGFYPDIPPGAPKVILLLIDTILGAATTEKGLRQLTKEVILHEIGHYLGMTHEQLNKYRLTAVRENEQLYA